MIEELKIEYDKNNDSSRDIELKIDKLELSASKTSSNDTGEDMKMESEKGKKSASFVGESKLIELALSTKSGQRKDGRVRRCRQCATCKYKCGECQSCVGDTKKSKAGCKRRYLCLKILVLLMSQTLYVLLRDKGRRMKREKGLPKKIQE